MKGTKLYITQSAEGPKHDPYLCRSLIFLKDELKVEYKEGLYERMVINGTEILPQHLLFPLEEAFEIATGITVHQFQRYYERIHNPKRCPNCGSKRRKWMSGFPGEEFMMCYDCDRIIDCTFNEGAII